MDAMHKIINRVGKSSKPLAARAPVAKSRESPGRNGATTRPVSQKITRKTITYAQMPKLLIITGQYLSR